MTAHSYDNYYSRFFLERRKFSPEQYEKEAQRLRHLLGDALPSSKDARVLELGCGVGFLLYFLRSCGQTHLEGVDLSAEAIALAGENACPDVEEGDIIAYLRKVKMEGKLYDAVYSMDTLEHLDKAELMELFTLVYQVLNPSGFFVVKVGNMANLTSTHLLYMDFTHKTGFTEESLAYLYRMAGFESMSILKPRYTRKLSQIKALFERSFHKFVYWLARASTPRETSRKIMVMGRKASTGA